MITSANTEAALFISSVSFQSRPLNLLPRGLPREDLPLLVEHLFGHGHRRIACVTGPIEETSGAERLKGYEEGPPEMRAAV